VIIFKMFSLHNLHQFRHCSWGVAKTSQFGWLLQDDLLLRPRFPLVQIQQNWCKATELIDHWPSPCSPSPQ